MAPDDRKMFAPVFRGEARSPRGEGQAVRRPETAHGENGSARVDQAVAALAQTTGFSRDERHAIITLIREQTMRTHAVDHACSVVLAQMGARDFEWPEFDRWHTIFARRSAFPPLWGGLERRPNRGDPFLTQQAYLKQKLYLLIDWLHGLVATRTEMR